VSKSVEVAVEEEIPAVCDYCQKPEPQYFCAICGYSFHAGCRKKHVEECASRLRGEMEAVECSVEDCDEPTLHLYRCSICERWFCWRHKEPHIYKEVYDAQFMVEE